MEQAKNCRFIEEVDLKSLITNNITERFGKLIAVPMEEFISVKYGGISAAGVPLYAYKPLREYERLYKETIGTSDAVGRHLWQSKKSNWAYLTSPIPENLK